MSRFLERFINTVAPVISFDNALEIVKAEGAWVTDATGKRYLDFGTGISVTNCGHNHPRVAEAVHAQVDKVWHGGGTFRFDSYVSAAEKIVSVTPDHLDMLFFLNSGSEAVEAAVKLARHTSGRQGVMAFRGAFHGRTMGSVSYTTSSARYRAGNFPLLPSVFIAPFPKPFHWGVDEATATARALEELQLMFRHEVPPQEIACFLIEPIQGEGGYYPAPTAFLQEIRRIADDHGILLIADEIQSGYGRAGSWWAVDHYGIAPDIMTLGKAIANGLPLSAVVANRDLFGKWPPGSHGTTYGGNAVACAAAAVVVDVIDDLLPGVAALSEHAFGSLDQLAARHSSIGEVRGRGLMIGIELVDDDGVADAGALGFVRTHVLDAGMIFHPCGPGGNIIRFIPPLVITPPEIDQAVALIDDALTAWEKRA
jgi:4-aminobutyrate aminotransferase